MLRPYQTYHLPCFAVDNKKMNLPNALVIMVAFLSSTFRCGFMMSLHVIAADPFKIDEIVLKPYHFNTFINCAHSQYVTNLHCTAYSTITIFNSQMLVEQHLTNFLTNPHHR